MRAVQLNFKPAIDKIDPQDHRTMLRVLEACCKETANRQIRDIYESLIDNTTFGCCVVATALFVAYRNSLGENWTPMLVADPDFPEDHVLSVHWVAKNLSDPAAPAVDITVADQEKITPALGSEAEIEAVQELLGDNDTLRRLQVGLDRFRDDEGSPMLKLTGAQLMSVYTKLLTQPMRPRHNLSVIPLAMFTKD